MNLFIAKWGELHASAEDLRAALRADAMYAKLSEGRVAGQWDSPCGTVSFACVHDGPNRAGPRRYLHNDATSIVAYDGLPIDAKRRYKAHVASDIDANWERFDADVDGFYGAIRITKSPLKLEVQSDLFGVYKTFAWTDGRSWLISNSVAAIDKLVATLDLDERSVSMFIAMAWVPGNHTLLEGVHCIEPGTRLALQGEKARAEKTSIAKATDFLRYPPDPVDDALLGELETDLLSVCETIGDEFPEVLCPLTGGKDSRLLAVLLREVGVPARSYTYGNALGADGKIALQVAEALGIEHENILTSTGVLFTRWDEVAADFVRRGAGMCPLQLITGSVTAELVNTPVKPLRLWGAGSSICRAPFYEPLDYVRKPDLAAVKRSLTRILVKDHGGLILPDAMAHANRYIEKRLDHFDGEGIQAQDLPDVLWIYERGAARSGKNMRATMNYRDTYSPFFAKSFAKASFAMSALQRTTEPLHYRLMKKLQPEVHAIRFDKGSWKSQNAKWKLTKDLAKEARFRATLLFNKRIKGIKQARPKHMLVKDTMFERVQWLKMLSAGMREQFSDPSNAGLWEVVNRDKFMAITAEDADEQKLALNAVQLFTIATVMSYRNERLGGR